VLTVSAIHFVQPTLRLNFAGHPIEYLLPLIGFLALAGTLYFRRRQCDGVAFLASSLFILGMLGSVACGMYPHILFSTTDPALSLTAFNAASDVYGLQAGLKWFALGFAFILACQLYAHLKFWGKVRSDRH
jgi:cytochrome d ubiquinol oxidase subunit II